MVLHRCDNPACANPGHLFLGTNIDNVQDMISKGRMPRGSSRPESRLNEEMVREIRRLFAAGASQRALQRKYGMSHHAIWCVVRGRTWTHVT